MILWLRAVPCLRGVPCNEGSLDIVSCSVIEIFYSEFQSQDIRKWFVKPHGIQAGNGNTSKQEKPLTPEKPPVVSPHLENVIFP